MKSFCLLVVSTIAFGSLSLFAKEPVFEGLGPYTRKITTDSPQAQRYFNQGLGFYHGFNHSAAIRAFQEAARIESEVRDGALGDRAGERSKNRHLRCSPYRLNIDA